MVGIPSDIVCGFASLKRTGAVLSFYIKTLIGKYLQLFLVYCHSIIWSDNSKVKLKVKLIR